MTGGYNFIDCAKRLGAVLIGRVEPSVQAVREAAMQLNALVEDPIKAALKSIYDSTVDEGTPDDMRELLDGLGSKPQHYQPSRVRIGGRRASN